MGVGASVVAGEGVGVDAGVGAGADAGGGGEVVILVLVQVLLRVLALHHLSSSPHCRRTGLKTNSRHSQSKLQVKRVLGVSAMLPWLFK